MIPEDKWLTDSKTKPKVCKHEWTDLYNGGGFKKGRPEVALMTFYCKWCLQIRTKSFDQSMYNMTIDESELNEPDDGVIA